jgi:threonine/homoserine/homoserine lactone efflux protein
MAAMGSSIGLHGDALQADGFSFHGTLFSTFSKSDAELHLFICWGALTLIIVVFAICIAWFLKRKDVRA